MIAYNIHTQVVSINLKIYHRYSTCHCTIYKCYTQFLMRGEWRRKYTKVVLVAAKMKRIIVSHILWLVHNRPHVFQKVWITTLQI